MSLAPEAPHPNFYEHSLPLYPGQAHEKFKAWQAGEPVFSTMEDVGTIPPYLGALLLGSRKILRASYGKVKGGSIQARQSEESRASLETIVRTDMERGGLQGHLRFATWAGDYDDTMHREMLHSDNLGHPSVRWTAAVGVGSTVGAEGSVCKADTLSTGDLRPDITVGLGGRLRLLTFPEGTVARFMNAGDIHGGPFGCGGRIMLQATLELL